MKRMVLAVFLVAVCGLSWYAVMKEKNNISNDYDVYIAAAEKAFEKKIYTEAEEHYKNALGLKPKDRAALFGLANTYFYEEKYGESAEVCEKLRVLDTGDLSAVKLEAECMKRIGKYRKAIDLLTLLPDSEEADAGIREAKSKYSLNYINAESVLPFDSCSKAGSCLSTVTEKGKAHAYNPFGTRMVESDLTFLGGVSDDGILYPAVQAGEACFVDKDGNRKLVPDEAAERFWPFCEGYAVFLRNGKYGYADSSLTSMPADFEAAYNFSDGKAAVKREGTVNLINAEFQVIKQTEYTGILSDDYGYTDHYGVSVFTREGRYFLCDSDGNSIGGFSAEYIGLPAESGGAVPYRRNGLYGFVSSVTGEVILEPVFEEAGAFCCGLAPAKQNGKWGFTDDAGEFVVSPAFESATPLSPVGRAWIKNEAGYAILTFYYLTEED